MLVLAREIHHLGNLGLGDLVGEYTTLPDAVMMDMEHDLGRGFDILLEELLQHVNDELHRGIIIVQYKDPIEVRPLGPWLDLGDNGSGRATGSAGTVLIVAQSGSRYDGGGWRG